MLVQSVHTILRSNNIESEPVDKLVKNVRQRNNKISIQAGIVYKHIETESYNIQSKNFIFDLITIISFSF